MVKVGVAGATGYTGVELLRILSLHPEVEVAFVTSERFSGRSVSETFPFLQGSRLSDLVFIKLEDSFEALCDLVFLALPHEVSSKVAPLFLRNGRRIVDLSAAFRIKNVSLYERFYGKHWSPELVKDAVYGIPELFRKEIKNANIVANPGCYPTSIIIPLYPLKEKGMLEGSRIVVDSKSGVSGAGREPSLGTLFSEVNEGVSPYKTFRHRHQPEMEGILGVRIFFSPHLVPMDRGILSSIYIFKDGLDPEEVYHALLQRYDGEPFVSVFWNRDVSTKHVRGTNNLVISVKPFEEGVSIFSAIDNLTRGASGQAVQNMNLMLGFRETLSLISYAIFP